MSSEWVLLCPPFTVKWAPVPSILAPKTLHIIMFLIMLSHALPAKGHFLMQFRCSCSFGIDRKEENQEEMSEKMQRKAQHDPPFCILHFPSQWKARKTHVPSSAHLSLKTHQTHTQWKDLCWSFSSYNPNPSKRSRFIFFFLHFGNLW